MRVFPPALLHKVHHPSQHLSMWGREREGEGGRGRGGEGGRGRENANHCNLLQTHGTMRAYTQPRTHKQDTDVLS